METAKRTSRRSCESSRDCELLVRIPFAEERALGRKRWTEYCIQLTIKDKSYKIYRRYSEFFELQMNLKRTLALTIPFPSKKFYGNLSPEFVDQRRKELESYLNKVLQNLLARDAPDVHAFLDCQQGKYLPCSTIMGLPLEQLES